MSDPKDDYDIRIVALKTCAGSFGIICFWATVYFGRHRLGLVPPRIPAAKGGPRIHTTMNPKVDPRIPAAMIPKVDPRIPIIPKINVDSTIRPVEIVKPVTNVSYSAYTRLPYSIDKLLLALNITPKENSLPTSTELKAAYQRFALESNSAHKVSSQNSLRKINSVSASYSGSKFREVTTQYQRALADIERLEKKQEARAKR